MANVCEIFGVSDIGYISKRMMATAVEDIFSKLQQTRVELFCENPHHPYFNGVPEKILAPMRIERISRRTPKNLRG
jgi:hypothetical protein